MALSTFFAFISLLSLTTALPLTSTINSCTTLTTPTTFTVSNFYTFTPSTTSTPPNTNLASVSFDITTAFRVHCTTISLSTSGTFTGTCALGVDPNIQTTFEYSGSTNKVVAVMKWVDCGSSQTTTLAGSTSIGKYCYPTQPPMPQGYGTQCQIPGNAVSGYFGTPVTSA